MPTILKGETFDHSNLVIHGQIHRFRRTAAECLVGVIAVTLATLVCFRLRLDPPMPTCLYMMVIVLVSARSSFFPAAIISIIAAGCMDYFFLPPIFSLELSHPSEYVALVAFLTTSMVITHLVSRVRDLTMEKLHRTEAYLSEAQRLSHTGSFGWRVSSGALIWSEETFRIFQYDPKTKPTVELILQRVHPDDATRVKETIERAQDGKDFDIEHRLLMPDGSIKHVRVVAHAERDRSGELEFIGALMDITAAKEAEAALRQVQADLAHVSRLTTMGEMTASIAHEVNQPLGAVINNANACISLLADGPKNSAEVNEALTEIIEGANRASAVVARVRQLSKKVPSEKSLLDLGSVVTEILTLTRYEAAARRVAIQLDLPEELPLVLGDRVQLQQVLLNLVVNAMDAMNEVEKSKRVVNIRGRPETRDAMAEVSIRVQDAGPGIKPEEMDRLFEAFYTTKPHGMGMGLAISRSIIEAHGGRLWADHKPGPGATVIFNLPAAPNAAP
jgi:signal transduction histidine kinase